LLARLTGSIDDPIVTWFLSAFSTETSSAGRNACIVAARDTAAGTAPGVLLPAFEPEHPATNATANASGRLRVTQFMNFLAALDGVQTSRAYGGSMKQL
jgi:hypothetical protein